MSRSNAQVNRALRSRPDEGGDTWSLPLRDGRGVGDCEDYALETRRLLIAAGAPAQALSIAVVAPPQGPVHAVLLVATDQGELVLDNLQPRILRWDQTGYRFIQRQVPGMPLRWVKVATGA
jgi:predicted transglutaminase-like cysteine proteinase